MIPSSNLVASQQAPLFWWKLVEKSGNRKLNWFTLYVSPWLWQRQRATHKASILLTPFLEYNIIWTTGPAAQNKLGIGLWVGIAHEFCGLWWEQFLRLTAAVTQLRKGHVWNCALFCWALRGDCLQSTLRNILHPLQKQKLPISRTNWCLRFSNLAEMCMLQD